MPVDLADLSDEHDEPVRHRLSIAGIGASGEGDLSERIEDLPVERFSHVPCMRHRWHVGRRVSWLQVIRKVSRLK